MIKSHAFAYIMLVHTHKKVSFPVACVYITLAGTLSFLFIACAYG